MGILALLLQACDGDQGSQGSAGPPGPQGLPGTGATVDVANAETITAVITRVTVPAAGQPVVEFGLADELERPLSVLWPPGNQQLAERQPVIRRARLAGLES